MIIVTKATRTSAIGHARNTDSVAYAGNSLGNQKTSGNSNNTVCDSPNQNVDLGRFKACKLLWQTNWNVATKKTMNERRTKGMAYEVSGTLPRTRLTTGTVKKIITTHTTSDHTSVVRKSSCMLAKTRSG